jgi:parallel beta-helix repeat protein
MILFLFLTFSSNLTLGSEVFLDSFENDSINIKNSEENNFFSPGELIVKFKDEINILQSEGTIKNTGKTSIDNLNKKYDVKSGYKLFNKTEIPSLSNIYKLVLSEDKDVLLASSEYLNNSYVEFAEPNYVLNTCNLPNDPYFYQQWSLNQPNDCDIDAPEAWDIETGDSKVIIAIIDTGVDHSHEDLSASLWINEKEDRNQNGKFDNWPSSEEINGTYGDIDKIDDDGNGFIDDIIGWDFGGRIRFFDDNDPMDEYGHGTHCAGIASASTDNGIGIAGVAWNCSIMSIKVVGRNEIQMSDVARGIVYAADNNASVISMSLGTPVPLFLLRSTVRYAYQKGVTLVAAAGNFNTDLKLFPAAYNEVIAVAATNNYDDKASFSSYGDWVDVAAPGDEIYSTFLNNSYVNFSGTSMSTPMVAGLAALIKSKNDDITPDKIREIINYSSDRVDPTFQIQRGRINARNALLRGTGNSKAIINSPSHGAEVKGVFEIKGSAYGDGFKNFIVEYSKGKKPDNSIWIEIINSTISVQNDLLCTLNTDNMDEGIYIIRLKVICNDGEYFDTIWTIVNNDKNEYVVDDDGEADYNLIQDAIYDSGNGDIIRVRNGLYYENLKIFKSIELIGEDKNITTIDGMNKGHVVYVQANNVKISGFKITNSTFLLCCGILLFNSQNCTITSNIIHNNSLGLKLKSSKKNHIIKNYFLDNIVGIRLVKRSNINLISKNNLISNRNKIILVHASIRNSYFNKWRNNYWQRLRILPYRIPYKTWDFSLFSLRPFFLRCNFDWRPAKAPFDI